MPNCLEALRTGYRDLVAGQAAYLPRADLYSPTGRPDDYYRWGSMSATCRSYGVTAIRIKSDIVSWPGGKREDKHCIEPGTYCGFILLFSNENGAPLALIQDGVLQHMRVGGSAGIGTDLLARPDAVTVGLLGSGGMAEVYLAAVAQVRHLRACRVYSPTPAHRAAFAARMAAELGIAVEPADSPEAAVRGADIVLSATNATGDTIDATWLAPGAHVTPVGRRELNDGVMDRADVTFQLGVGTLPPGTPLPGLEWPISGMAAMVTGTPAERAVIPQGRSYETRNFPNLTELMAGRMPGRTGPDQVTVFINVGTQGLQFAAVAGLVYRRAVEQGLGTPMPLEWFLQDIRD